MINVARCAGVLAIICTAAGPAGVAAASITPTNDGSAIARAIAKNAADVTGGQFDTLPSGKPAPFDGPPNAIADTALTGFPLVPPNYAILSTGDARLAETPNNSGTTTGNEFFVLPTPGRGDTAKDVSVLRVNLNVPAKKNCLGVDFRFLTEEYPNYVGSPFNDGFIAELDASTWTTSGSAIIAPDNFAFDPAGRVISVNGSGPAAMSAANAAGTTYGGATALLRAQKPITPGAHSVFLSIFDQKDHILDSAVFLDNAVALRRVNPRHCVSELVTPAKCAGKDADVTGTAKKDTLVGTAGPDVINGVGGNDKIKGLKGKDTLCGEAGKDKIIGGPGKDKIIGGPGKDKQTQ